MSNAQLSFESGAQLSVRSMSVNETLSASFQIDVVALGADDLDLATISGRPAAFGISSAGGNRVWTGLCSKISQTQVESDGLSTYALQIVPAFWLLNHRLNHRIFQHKSIPEIVQTILGEWQLRFENKLQDTYPKREYVVQYGETDHDFVRRLLVQAGISFFFETKSGGGGPESTMILSDVPTGATPRQPLPFLRSPSGAEHSPHISGVSIQRQVKPGRAVFRDFDFRRPSFPLAGVHSAQAQSQQSLLEQYYYLPGSSNVRSEGGGGNTPVADQGGAYRHDEKEATSQAQRHVEALQSAGFRTSFATSVPDLSPGTVFSMTGHPHPDAADGKSLLVLSSWLSGEINEQWTMGGEAASADMPFRPLLTAPKPSDHHRGTDEGPFMPLSRLDKPRIQGLQNAVVVGPAGEEIYTDEYGRVRVQFPWDREAKGDENGSCWVRVSQAWAGPSFGAIIMPRVGQEVLVGFQEGDPDLPMVVGRMFDTTSPVPYPLPQHKTRTSLRSASKNGSNELTFEDDAGKELMYLEATRDLHKIVKQHELEETRGNRHLTVEGDLVLAAKGNVIIKAGKDLVFKGGPNVHINPPSEVKDGEKPVELSSGEAPPPKPEPPKPEPPKPEPGKSAAAQANEQLFKMNPGGPTDQFNQIAAARKAQAEKYQDLAKQIGEKYDIPPAMALAWMNRESAYGDFLNSQGYSKFDGQGFGLFQVDKRYHTPVGGPADWDHIDQAMGIFNNTKSQIKAKNPGWTEEEYLAAALVGYNSGPKNAQTRPSSAAAWAQLDGGTAHVADPNGDYSRDIWSEAQWYANNLKW